MFNSEDFVKCASSISDEIEKFRKVGTYNIYKLAASFVTRNGYNKDNINTRGRRMRLK